MAPADDVGADVVPTAGEIADPFFGFRRHVDRRQLAGAEEAHELGGVPAIGLHALPGLARRQGGGDHGTVHAERRELTIEIVAGHAGFITGPDRCFPKQPLEEATHLPRFVRDLTQLGLRGVGPQNSRHDDSLAVVECDVCNGHDRPPFACGSVPSRNNPRIRDRSGRSFHMV